MHFDTKAVHSGFDKDPSTGASTVPIYQSAAFAYDSGEDLENVFKGRKFGHVYSRISNPTVTAFEKKVTELEDGLASVAVATGMAAVHSVFLALTETGDHIVVSKSLFGGTLELIKNVLEPNGVSVTLVDATNPEAYAAAITDKTRLIFVESIGNPKCDVPPIKLIADVAKKHNLPLVVDSTLTTPLLLRGKDLGVNIVVHSATKYFGLGGTTVGGVFVDLGNFDWKNSKSKRVAELSKKCGEFAFIYRCRSQIVANIGCSLSPFNAFIFNLGLETLGLRIERQSRSALAVAEALSSNKNVKAVNYPGLKSSSQHDVAKAQFNGNYGGLLTIRLKDKGACFRCIKKVKILKNLANLGDSRTLIIHPASTIYSQLSEKEMESAGVYPDMLRLSIGLEHPDDIIGDLSQALEN